MNWDWLLGFIEGEGNFNIVFTNQIIKCINCYQILFNITITQNDLDSLNQIKLFLKDYNIDCKIYSNNTGKFTHYLKIYKQKDINLFLQQLLKLSWFTKKKESFQIFVLLFNKYSDFRKDIDFTKNIISLTNKQKNDIYLFYEEVFLNYIQRKKLTNKGRKAKRIITLQDIKNSILQAPAVPSHH